MMKNLTILAAVVVIVGLGSAQIRTAGPTMVTVSLQRVSAQSEIGKRAGQQLEALRQERSRELTAKQKELDEVVRQLTRTSGLSAADRERLSGEETQRRAESQQLSQQAQTSLQAAQAKLQAEIRAQLVPILADIAKRYSADVVLNSDIAVAWAAPGTDTTDEVLRRLNAPPQ